MFVPQDVHYLTDMPPRCKRYEPQPDVERSIRNFCSSNNGSRTNSTRTCLLHGLVGGGKTQSCVAFMEDAESDPMSELSTFGK